MNSKVKTFGYFAGAAVSAASAVVCCRLRYFWSERTQEAQDGERHDAGSC